MPGGLDVRVGARAAALRLTRQRRVLQIAAGTRQGRGLGFGEHGEGYVRIALVENTHRLRQAIRNIRTFMHAGSNVAEPILSEAAAP
jgi:bifunctional pyridoxal-dependent enzyme with beta-cystathionase and maltose regulon repressor activities